MFKVRRLKEQRANSLHMSSLKTQGILAHGSLAGELKPPSTLLCIEEM